MARVCNCVPHFDLQLFLGAHNGPLRCGICIGNLSRPVELACGHTYCWVCLVNAAQPIGRSKHTCPLCHKVHILDPNMLRERRDSYRRGYRAWRQGYPHGARGEVGTVKLPDLATRNFAATQTTGTQSYNLAGAGTEEKNEEMAATEVPCVAVEPVNVRVTGSESFSPSNSLSDANPQDQASKSGGLPSADESAKLIVQESALAHAKMETVLNAGPSSPTKFLDPGPDGVEPVRALLPPTANRPPPKRQRLDCLASKKLRITAAMHLIMCVVRVLLRILRV
eukprot:SAG11_NODE_1310_length_5236_cov_2.603270_6_plen_281_part_00